MSAFLLAAQFLSAQEFRSALTGRVTDPSGAVVPNATVQAVNTATQQSYSAKTTGAGAYYIPYMLPGSYTVTVNDQGFKKQVQQNVVLEASTSHAVNFTLQVGEETQTVSVTDTPPLLENASGSGGTILSTRELSNLPLNGRQVYSLIGTTPGSQSTSITQGTTSAQVGHGAYDNNSSYTIGGGVQGYQQFTLNGTNITNQTNYQSGTNGEWQLAPNVDALQEVNVMTSTYDARYGRTGGGTVNMVVKSGTNGFHGTAYDYLENGDLNANFYESNLNGVPRQKVNQNQFGGTIGGPIKKDKMFFFGSFEGFRQKLPATQLENVPAAYLRPGPNGVNFDNTAQSGTLYQVYDPSSTYCVGGGALNACPSGQYLRNPYPNNTIPTSAINPIGAALLNLYPLPNTNPTGLTQNFLANTQSTLNYYQPMGRVDYDTSDKTRWYSLFAFQHGVQNQNNNGFSGVAEQGNLNHIRQDVTASQDMTHIFTPTLLADFKLSFTRFMDFQADGNLSAAVDPTSIGLNMPNIPTTTLKDLPELSWATSTGTATSGINGNFVNIIGNNETNDVWNNLTFDNDWTKTVSNHTIHFGGEVGEYQFADPRTVQRPNGYFQFSSQFTQANPLQANTIAGAQDGYALADLLLGYPDRGTASQTSSGVDWADTIFEGYPAWALYFQDDWKATRKLTVNIGLRYDVQVGVRERHNLLARGICTQCVNPIASNPQFQANLNNPANQAAWAAAGVNPALFQTPIGGYEFAGQNGQTRDAYNTDWSNWEPRFGFAYQLDPKTVLRGGYGIEYAVGLEGGSSDSFAANTPYIGSLNNNITPTNYFASGNPYPSGAQAPAGNTLGLLTNVGNVAQLDFPGRRIPRSQIASFGIQRELPGQMVLGARWSGNFTDRLRTFVWLNGTMPLSQYQQAITNSNYFNQQVPNPYYGVVPQSTTVGSSPTVPAENLLTSNSQFLRVGSYDDPLNRSNYNALEVKLDKRFSQGLSFQLSYTYSKTMYTNGYLNGWPYQDQNLLYEISPYDRTHIFSLTGEYTLPVGKGQRWGSGAHGVVNQLITGWNVDWVFNWQTGLPVAINQGYSYSCGHSFTPNGGPSMGNYIYNNYSNGSATGCWNTLPQYGLEYLPQYLSTLRQFSIPNLDISLQKDFPIHENVRLQFRADAFNLTNSVLFGAPDSNPGDGPPTQLPNGTYQGFGTVGATQLNLPRVIQFSLKLLF